MRGMRTTSTFTKTYLTRLRNQIIDGIAESVSSLAPTAIVLHVPAVIFGDTVAGHEFGSGDVVIDSVMGFRFLATTKDSVASTEFMAEQVAKELGLKWTFRRRSFLVFKVTDVVVVNDFSFHQFLMLSVMWGIRHRGAKQ